MNKRFIRYLSLSICILIALLITLYWKLYLIKSNSIKKVSVHQSFQPDKSSQPNTTNYESDYSGSDSCAACHQDQFNAWRKSHHDHSMQTASGNTIKGNFNNISFPAFGVENLFYKKDELFYIRTRIEKEIHDFQILYTLGISPLQQYIVEFPDGKWQMLPVAWDTIEKKWFHLQASLKPKPDEWIHWTKGGMNWNSMCADCHTTNLNKNYKQEQQNYNSTWSAINVGCEACHGPGQEHINIVSHADYKPGANSFKLDLHKGADSKIIVDKCGRCHSRRQQLTQFYRHDSNTLLDHYQPAILSDGLYHSDGQILDEVFIYGSFIQSSMYQVNVSCINCHDPHTARLKSVGNTICTSCHIKSQYDSPDHHHHKNNTGHALVEQKDSIGNQCVDCHMPGRHYMQIDYRRDHSFRVPRPDLSIKFNTPNACNDCHKEKTNAWASEHVNKWFSKNRKPHYSDVLAAFSTQPEQYLEQLIALIEDNSQPPIVRATAVSKIKPWMSSPILVQKIQNILSQNDPLLRTYGTQALTDLPMEDKISLLTPMLNDPVRSVRIAAAKGLIESHRGEISQNFVEAYDFAMHEYQEFLKFNADYPAGKHQIALDYHKQGQFPEAENAYLQTLVIDNHFNSARMNLAQLYYQQGYSKKAVNLYRKVIEQEPNAPSAHYSLGLLMAELGNYLEAEKLLEIAAKSASNSRAWYNLAILQQRQGKLKEAQVAYQNALQIESLNIDYIQGLLSLYAQQQHWQDALELIQHSLQQDPENSALLSMKDFIQNKMKVLNRQL